MSIFGDDINPSIPILDIIIVSIYFEAIRNPYGVQVLSTGHIKLGFYISIFTLLLNSFLNLILIPNSLGGIDLFGLGAIGAAYATLISFLARNIIARVAASRITKHPINFRIFIHFFAALIFYVLAKYIQSAISSFYLFFLIYIISGVIIFYGILFILGEFTKSDFNYILNSLNHNKMSSYIYNELKK